LILQEKIAIFEVADPMSESFLGQYVPGDSWLHNADPRSKLIATFAISTALLGTGSLAGHGLIAVLMAAGLYASGLPMRALIRNLRPFLWLFVIVFLAHALFGSSDGRQVARIWRLTITTSDLSNGALYSLRLTLLVVVAALLTMTTMPLDLMDGLARILRPLRRVRVPVEELTLMMGLALRFIPTLLSEANRIRKAQLSRGANLEGGLVQRFRAVLPLVLPLFVSAFRRADDLAMAMEARCYVPDGVRSHYRDLHFEIGDHALVVGSLLLVLASFVLNMKGWPF
jgi:energy-coupling factor transport system permease protein